MPTAGETAHRSHVLLLPHTSCPRRGGDDLIHVGRNGRRWKYQDDGTIGGNTAKRSLGECILSPRELFIILPWTSERKEKDIVGSCRNEPIVWDLGIMISLSFVSGLSQTQGSTRSFSCLAESQSIICAINSQGAQKGFVGVAWSMVMHHVWHVHHNLVVTLG